MNDLETFLFICFCISMGGSVLSLLISLASLKVSSSSLHLVKDVASDNNRVIDFLEEMEKEND